jgi:hypothetical protein
MTLSQLWTQYLSQPIFTYKHNVPLQIKKLNSSNYITFKTYVNFHGTKTVKKVILKYPTWYTIVYKIISHHMMENFRRTSQSTM